MGAESLEASPLRERCVDFTRLSFDRLPFADALEELPILPTRYPRCSRRCAYSSSLLLSRQHSLKAIV